MKRFQSLMLGILLGCTAFSAENLTQTVRGTVIDKDNQSPLIGAAVVAIFDDEEKGTVTNANGEFRFENIPTGYIQLKLSYLGYHPKTEKSIRVNSAQEVVLNLSMEQSDITLNEIVVNGSKQKGNPQNEMSLISSRSISAADGKRFSGGFDDPSRLVTNFAGVAATATGSSDIIVRGNAPKYIQWRLEDVEITSPYHFDDQNASFGGLSALNNNLLSMSDFHTGAFTAEFGNVLSAVYDVHLRNGNNEKFEAALGIGLLGTDVTLEGPFKKGYNGSYLINYRYSTVSVISDLGLTDINGTPDFQDATYKINLPTKQMGTFSLFGVAGLSRMFITDVSPALTTTPFNTTKSANIVEDYKKQNHLMNVGLNHVITTSPKGYLKTSITYSNSSIEDEIFEYEKPLNDNDNIIKTKRKNFDNQIQRSFYRASVNYKHKFSAKSKVQLGTKYTVWNYDFNQATLEKLSGKMDPESFNNQASTLNNYACWKYRILPSINLAAGIHNMNVLLNNKSTFEPRLGINWALDTHHTLSFGYGMHSKMESIHHYFAKIEQTDGSLIQPNKDLDLLKAHHYVLGFEKRFSENLRAKAEVYYQDLYNIPVENDETSYYSTLNEGINYRYIDLVNEGTGKNYGVELTLERFFNNDFYFLLNGSLFDSKYTAKDGIERNTQFNNEYLVNLLIGKECTGLGKKQNKTLALNAKMFLQGGQKYIPLLKNENGDLSIDQENNQFWDYSKAYENSLDQIFQLNFSLSYKVNRKKTTHELFIDLQNLTNNTGRISEYYDETEPNSIGYITQFGFFPNLMYKVYF